MTSTVEPSAPARRVRDVLRARGRCTRTELTAATGLSRPTVAAALAELAGAGLLTEEQGVAPGPAGGRPAVVLRLSRAAGLAVGLDLGRTHVRVAVCDLGHDLLADRLLPLAEDSEDRPLEVLDAAAALVTEVLADLGTGLAEVVGVGLGIPAPVTRAGRIGAPALLPAWADLAPATELATRLGVPVYVDNDANLGALGEYLWGAGRGSPVLVYVKLATGIGAGLVLGGTPFRGSVGTAGELGHVTLDARGPVCRCGNRGCVELTVGGRALLAAARATHPELRTLADVVAKALAGDPGCRRLLADAGTQVGVALGGLVNLLNPDRIVLGGDLGRALELLVEPLRRGLADAAMAAAAGAVSIVTAELGDRSSVRGAVALVLRAG